ncbi:MAG: hypothetical protein OSA51_07280 [Octadecabacter sp.]|nr:hypothetical protein [Octadecabacter sp.]
MKAVDFTRSIRMMIVVVLLLLEAISWDRCCGAVDWRVNRG